MVRYIALMLQLTCTICSGNIDHIRSLGLAKTLFSQPHYVLCLQRFTTSIQVFVEVIISFVDIFLCNSALGV